MGSANHSIVLDSHSLFSVLLVTWHKEVTNDKHAGRLFSEKDEAVVQKIICLRHF